MDQDLIYSQYMYNYPHKTAYRKLVGIQFSDVKDQLYQGASNLYLHIPFCQSRCGFCNLFMINNADNSLIDRYLDAVSIQTEQMNLAPIRWSSFIIGGGTPLLLSAKQLTRLFQIVFDRMFVDMETYKVIETSPNDTTAEKISVLKSFGVNRVSIGVQSFVNSELKTLGRKHLEASAHQALSMLTTANFEAINIDIIYGIPHQTMATLQYSIEQVVRYHPDEIFLYPLYNTKQNEEIYLQYFAAKAQLLQSGYLQTSMRRFVKKGHIDMATTDSCGFENSLALGAGGRSYLGNLHFCTKYSKKMNFAAQIIDEFIQQSDKTAITNGYILSLEEKKRSYLIKNLFFYTGLSQQDYHLHFNNEVRIDFPIINDFIESNYCRLDGDRILLTETGMSLSDYLGPMFISPEVQTRSETWKDDLSN